MVEKDGKLKVLIPQEYRASVGDHASQLVSKISVEVRTHLPDFSIRKWKQVNEEVTAPMFQRLTGDPVWAISSDTINSLVGLSLNFFFILPLMNSARRNSPTTASAQPLPEGDGDGNLRRVLQFSLWVAEGIYILWLFLLPYAPGDPVWAISSDTINSLVGLSLNFFFILPLMNSARRNSPTTASAQPLPEGDGDGNLRRVLQFSLWVAEGIYILWLFLLPYAPGDPVWAISSDTINSLVGLSLNFFFILPLMNSARRNSPTTASAQPLPEGDGDGNLRRVLQFSLWVAEGIYILWLFLLPYAPGDPVWAISSDTINSLVGLSLNFFFILPLMNSARRNSPTTASAQPLPEGDGDGNLRRVLQFSLWVAEGIYILWLFLLPYAPGDPVWAISSDTINSLVGLSLNFFFILPLMNSARRNSPTTASAQPLPEGDGDGNLRRVLQFSLWVAEGIYILWLFLLPYAPGDPVWAISSDTINSLVGLSLNFFFILPLMNSARRNSPTTASAQPLPEGDGDGNLRRVLQFSLWVAEGIYILWLFLLPYAPGDPVWAISSDTINSLVGLSLNFFFILPLMNSAFLIPYMAIRLDSADAQNTPTKSSQLASVMTNGAPVVGLIGGAICLISTLWALFGRPDGNFGGIADRWDFLKSKVNIANYLRFVPVVGLVVYLVCLNLDEERVPERTGRTNPRFSNQYPNDQAHRGTCTRVQRGTGSPPANPPTSKLERELEYRDRLEIESLTFFLSSTFAYILCAITLQDLLFAYVACPSLATCLGFIGS
ncbi:hypothetical protein TEA_006726 [Camellia sinensis var. sinensis]|uniref:Uncharacterized protein n=1 Tax=Camellia sinensis var. sinensis TaxID=542762 RepID=A0A4S4D8X7_CAMSN|nr:hypothetical protein TEA_006726 [Camellia sinensis var. sinensis]